MSHSRFGNIKEKESRNINGKLFELSVMVVTLLGSMNLGEWSPKRRQNKGSCNSQLYSGHLKIYILRVFARLGKVI